MGYDFTKAVANLAKGCRLRRDGDDGWEMVMPVPNPDGATIDRLMREGWLEMMPNGGTAKISDAGLKAYLRATDEMGRGVLEMTPQKTKVPTCPDCDGLGYIGGEGTDVPSSCMNKFHKLALDESFERVAKVAEERAEFNKQTAVNERKAIIEKCIAIVEATQFGPTPMHTVSNIIRRLKALARDAKAIEAGTVETERLDAKHESAVAKPFARKDTP